ncbi:MAG TPA: cytochrome c oxidase subunit 3 [Thermoplasmata archaeon]|jgi:heme/copper-type cytochrome/quinol oxidase subunit 3
MAEARIRRHGEAGVHHGSPWPFVIALGAALGYVGLITSVPLLALGLVVFLAGLLGWLRDDVRVLPKPFYGVGAALEAKFPQVSARKLGTWLFLATEIMFFSAIIGASWTLRFRTSDPLSVQFLGPWASPGQILNIPGTGVATFILICSSLTMVEALAAIERGDQKRLKIFLGATLALGLTFLAFQGNEFYHLYFSEHLTFAGTPYGVNRLFGPTFFIQTGTHGAHVTGGVCAIAYTLSKAIKGGFTKVSHETVELVGLYWHFVDVVWIFLFTIVYLI